MTKKLETMDNRKFLITNNKKRETMPNPWVLKFGVLDLRLFPDSLLFV